jgi:hypothetical protein
LIQKSIREEKERREKEEREKEEGGWREMRLERRDISPATSPRVLELAGRGRGVAGTSPGGSSRGRGRGRPRGGRT